MPPTPSIALNDQWHAEIADRLRVVTAGLSLREVARRTGVSPDTVRRYLGGARPAVSFIAAASEAFNVRCTWLMLGRGPMHLEDWEEMMVAGAK